MANSYIILESVGEWRSLQYVDLRLTWIIKKAKININKKIRKFNKITMKYIFISTISIQVNLLSTNLPIFNSHQQFLYPKLTSNLHILSLSDQSTIKNRKKSTNLQIWWNSLTHYFALSWNLIFNPHQVTVTKSEYAKLSPTPTESHSFLQ